MANDEDLQSSLFCGERANDGRDKADERSLNREAAKSFEDYFELVLIRHNWSRTESGRRRRVENSF